MVLQIGEGSRPKREWVPWLALALAVLLCYLFYGVYIPRDLALGQKHLSYHSKAATYDQFKTGHSEGLRHTH